MSDTDIIIEPLRKNHNRSSFHCGHSDLDRYIKDYAGQDFKRHIATVFVAQKDNQVIGFYTLSATIISRDSFPLEIARKLPKYPIPSALIGRLAIDQSYQGKGIGKILMVNAIKRVYYASSVIGMFALIVDAKDENAKSFYFHFGFMELLDNSMRLFLPMDTIEELI